MAMNLMAWLSTKSPKLLIGRLPISTEKFAKFLFPGKLNGDFYKYDKKMHKNLCDEVAMLIGERRMNIIHKMGMMLACDMTSKLTMFTEPSNHLSIFDDIMDILSFTPIWIFDDAIGHGFTGSVYDYDENNVIKIFYTKLNNAERQWVNFQIMNNLQIFPYIKEWGENYVIMEKLSTFDSDLSEIRQLIESTTAHMFEQEVGYRILNNNYIIAPMWYKTFINKICLAMTHCFGINTIGDLTVSNVAIRPSTKEIVLMDPIDGLLSKKNQNVVTNSNNSDLSISLPYMTFLKSSKFINQD